MTAPPGMPSAPLPEPEPAKETESVYLLRQMVIAIDRCIRRRLDEGKPPLPGSLRYEKGKKRKKARRQRQIAENPPCTEGSW